MNGKGQIHISLKQRKKTIAKGLRIIQKLVETALIVGLQMFEEAGFTFWWLLCRPQEVVHFFSNTRTEK